MTRILVYMEHEGGVASDVSLQLLALARRQDGAEVTALCAAADPAGLAAQALSHGANEALIVADASLASYLGRPVSQALKAAIEETQPRLVLLPAGTIGNDLAPLCAATLDAACILDGDGLELDGSVTRVFRTEYDARVKVALEAEGLCLVTLKDGICESAEAAGGDTKSLDVAIDAGTASVQRREVATKTVNLKDAPVIVGGGAGLGNAENFALLEKLARKLGGELGATRASVDAGWISAERQIGQTGVTVRPNLYIACGISGAIQHVVGIRDAKTIVAINSDAGAPIFRVSHYKLVGDLNTIIPKLLELLD
jgi:electron transfer flavoprotein alpha subunit